MEQYNNIMHQYFNKEEANKHIKAVEMKLSGYDHVQNNLGFTPGDALVVRKIWKEPAVMSGKEVLRWLLHKPIGDEEAVWKLVEKNSDRKTIYKYLIDIMKTPKTEARYISNNIKAIREYNKKSNSINMKLLELACESTTNILLLKLLATSVAKHVNLVLGNRYKKIGKYKTAMMFYRASLSQGNKQAAIEIKKIKKI